MDGSVLRARLPRVAEVKVDGFVFAVTHGDQLRMPEPQELKATFPRAEVIVYGHTNCPLITDFDDYVVACSDAAALRLDFCRRAFSAPEVVAWPDDSGRLPLPA